MTDEDASTDPDRDPNYQPSPQLPVSATATPPAEHKVGNDPEKGTNGQGETAKELAREFRWVEGLQLAINGVLAVIGIIALCIYSGQLTVMRGQLGEIIKQYAEIQKSANAATSAANTASQSLVDSQNSFVLNERPYIVISENPPIQFIENPVPDKQIQANVTMRNIGKTPAVYFVPQVRLIKYRAEPDTPEGHKKNGDFFRKTFDELTRKNAVNRREIIQLSSETDIAPENSTFTTSQDDVRLSADEISEMHIGKIAILYVGVITYTDSFGGGLYKTEFCYYHFGTDVRVWHVCNNNNTIK